VIGCVHTLICGACCYPDGHCEYVTEANCPTGDWQLGVPCEPNPCPQPTVACCFPDGTCQDLTAADCTAQGGSPQPYPSACATTVCPQPTGACCYPDGTCEVTLEEECPAWSIWHSEWTTCDPNACPEPSATLSLLVNPTVVSCYHHNNTITVAVYMSDATVKVYGGQFFLSYDKDALDFTGVTVGDDPFTNVLLEVVDEEAGTIDYAVSVEPGEEGTQADTTMAIITFRAIGDVCDVPNVVAFRSHDPPTALTAGDPNGTSIPLTLNNLPAILIDSTPPVITCPADITVECDESTDPNSTGRALATDNCDPSPRITYSDVVNMSGCGGYTGTITRTWKARDACDNESTCVQVITVNDVTAPVISGCPGDITVPADAGGCTARVTWTLPTASDNCDPNPVVTCNPPSGSVFPQGTTVVTCTARDACDNVSQCTFNVTVSAFNELVVSVELSPTMVVGPITRCITFQLWECPGTAPSATVDQVVTFTNGSSGNVTVLVPCGNYNCITARDKLHTLRRTDEAFGIVGTQYVADFTGNPATGGDWLIGGNLNDDRWIDILDFGVFSSQWSSNYGTGNTTCTTPRPHADINGDGVVWTEDFTFIQINFLRGHEANCCGQPGLLDEDRGVGPITEISVKELIDMGMPELAAGDLNGDGWLTVDDIVAFLNGAVPQPQPPAEQATPPKPQEEQPNSGATPTPAKPVADEPRRR